MSPTDQYCPGCGRVTDRCVCEIEFAQEEPRASRMPENLPSVDPLFSAAAASGFAPLTPEQKEDFREKLRGASAAAGGGRR